MSDKELTYEEHTKAKDFLKMGQDDLRSGMDSLCDFPEDEFKKTEPGKCERYCKTKPEFVSDDSSVEHATCEAFGSKEQLRGTKEKIRRFTFNNGDEIFLPESNKDDVADSNINEIIKSAFTHSEYVGWLKGNILEHRLLAGKDKSYVAGIAQADKYQYYYDEYVRENTP